MNDENNLINIKGNSNLIQRGEKVDLKNIPQNSTFDNENKFSNQNQKTNSNNYNVQNYKMHERQNLNNNIINSGNKTIFKNNTENQNIQQQQQQQPKIENSNFIRNPISSISSYVNNNINISKTFIYWFNCVYC